MNKKTWLYLLPFIIFLMGAVFLLRGSVDIWMLVLVGIFTLLTAPVIAHSVGRVAYREQREEGETTTLRELFASSADPNITVAVNKYLWNASLDVLNFLPIQSIDPFTGVIVTGYGTPPGGGRSYRATIYVQDPALDARSLKVAYE